MAAAQLRAPLYEDKVVDFLFSKAEISERTATRAELEADLESEEGHVHGPGCGHDHAGRQEPAKKAAAAKPAAKAKAEAKPAKAEAKPAAKVEAKATPAKPIKGAVEKTDAKPKAGQAGEGCGAGKGRGQESRLRPRPKRRIEPAAGARLFGFRRRARCAARRRACGSKSSTRRTSRIPRS